MIHTTLFLIAAALVIKKANPEEISQVILHSVMIPVIGLLLYGLFGWFRSGYNLGYYTGSTLSYAFFPALISGIVIFIYLKRKLNKKESGIRSLVFIIIILVIISLLQVGLGIYTDQLLRNL